MMDNQNKEPVRTALAEMVKMMDDGDEPGAGSKWYQSAVAALAAPVPPVVTVDTPKITAYVKIDGSDWEYNGIDEFSGARTGGIPLVALPDALAHTARAVEQERYRVQHECADRIQHLIVELDDARAAQPAAGELPPLPASAMKCWSCGEQYDLAEHADADGNCPHCGVEIEQDEPVQQPAAPLCLVAQLREFAGDAGYSHNDYADVMRHAAEEIERLTVQQPAIVIPAPMIGDERPAFEALLSPGEDRQTAENYFVHGIQHQKSKQRPVQQPAAADETATQVQWRNINHTVREVAKFCFGGADHPQYGASYMAVVNCLSAKDGVQVNLEPLPVAPAAVAGQDAIGYVVSHDPSGGNFFTGKAGYKNMKVAYGDRCKLVYTAPAPAPAAAVVGQKRWANAINALLAVATAAYEAMDNSEERANASGGEDAEYVIQGNDFTALSAAMDQIDALPDDRPGCTLSGGARARWALRDLFTVPAAGVQGDFERKRADFIAHLSAASTIVETWPDWKKNIWPDIKPAVTVQPDSGRDAALVQRYSMTAGKSQVTLDFRAKEYPDPDGEWVRYEDHIATHPAPSSDAALPHIPTWEEETLCLSSDSAAEEINKAKNNELYALRKALGIRRPQECVCGACGALWQFWPKEQSGFGQDTLSLKSKKSCDFCERASFAQLDWLRRMPNSDIAAHPANGAQAGDDNA